MMILTDQSHNWRWSGWKFKQVHNMTKLFRDQESFEPAHRELKEEVQEIVNVCRARYRLWVG